jgi:hypothetical protein
MTEWYDPRASRKERNPTAEEREKRLAELRFQGTMMEDTKSKPPPMKTSRRQSRSSADPIHTRRSRISRVEPDTDKTEVTDDTIAVVDSEGKIVEAEAGCGAPGSEVADAGSFVVESTDMIDYSQKATAIFDYSLEPFINLSTFPASQTQHPISLDTLQSLSGPEVNSEGPFQQNFDFSPVDSPNMSRNASSSDDSDSAD